MTTVSPWPIDFDALSIGDVVKVEEIESSYNVSRHDKAYKIKAQLPLLELIRRRRPDLDPYLRTHQDDIVVMDDSEATRHQRKRFSLAARQMITTHRRTMGVNPNALEESERIEHEKAVYANGRVLSAMDRERRELRLQPHQRNTPLTGKVED